MHIEPFAFGRCKTSLSIEHARKQTETEATSADTDIIAALPVPMLDPSQQPPRPRSMFNPTSGGVKGPKDADPERESSSGSSAFPSTELPSLFVAEDGTLYTSAARPLTMGNLGWVGQPPQQQQGILQEAAALASSMATLGLSPRAMLQRTISGPPPPGFSVGPPQIMTQQQQPLAPMTRTIFITG